VLLQKTLLNIEGLGRELDPNLDLWVTAMPFLERWMEDRIGFPALRRRLLAEAPYIVDALPELPRLIHQRLTAQRSASDAAMRDFADAQRTQNRLLTLIALLLAIAAGLVLWKLVVP
jgi:ubiquinone biosynthesis protein